MNMKISALISLLLFSIAYGRQIPVKLSGPSQRSSNASCHFIPDTAPLLEIPSDVEVKEKYEYKCNDGVSIVDAYVFQFPAPPICMRIDTQWLQENGTILAGFTPSASMECQGSKVDVEFWLTTSRKETITLVQPILISL
jgi:hypothetical protein